MSHILMKCHLGNCDIELPHQVAESHWFFMGDNRDDIGRFENSMR